jgi:uncharacterized membrane protein YheB (UPF0754 family)
LPENFIVLTFDASLLTALAHPGLGAFIGYLTNKVAIRMLFRPLEPWYLFGLRVPMTPGVIPSKRHDLAENIGEMVGRHLLTSKDIGAAVSEEPFQEHLADLVDRRVREIMMRDLGPITEVVPRKLRAYFKIGVKTLKYQLNIGVNQYLAGDRFVEQLTASINSRLDTLAAQDINALFAPENRRDLYLVIGEVISDLLRGERAASWLGDALAAGLRQTAAEGKRLGEVLPGNLAELIKRGVSDHADQILAGMGRQVADPLIRAQVVSGVLGGVDRFLDSLGPMGAMARGFLERATLEQKVAEYLQEKETDLVAWLASPEIRSRMVTVLEQAVDELLRKPIAEILAGIEKEDFTRLCRDGAGYLLGLLQKEGALNGISAFVHVGMEDLVNDGQRTFADLGRQWFPEDRGERFREVLARECVALVRSNDTARLVNAMLDSMVDTLVQRPIGMLFNIVPHGIRQAMTSTIVLMVNRMLLQEVPGVVESLNIKQLVTEKIDRLDLLQLERLLLSIMEEQFKYINLFGAFLGFLIGLVNLALVEFL